MFTKRFSLTALCLTGFLFCSPVFSQNAAPAAAPAAKKSAVQAPAAPAKSVESATSAAPVAQTPDAQSTKTVLQVVANVNNEEISRKTLVESSLEDYGMDVLNTLATRLVIENACQAAKITVSDEEIIAEIDETAKKFSIPKDQYLKLLEEERGISPKRFVDEIIRPTIAIRKLAGSAVKVTDEDLQFEFERNYGTAVKVRMISVATKEEAEKVRAEVEKDPTQFAALAQKYSTDSYSAALGGTVPPLRKHMNDEAVETVLFSMKAGDLSQPIQLGNQYVILLCDEVIPPTTKLEDIRTEIEAIVSQRKQREVGQEFMKTLLDKAKIELFYGDKAKMDRRPGAAAVVDGKVISMAVLGDECVKLYGKEALTGLINLTLIRQELKKRNITIADEDLQAKVAEDALMNLPPLADGKPNVEGWLAKVTQQNNVTKERYIRDAIWPSVALEKLAANRFEITDEDLQRGYEANFGKKVRCRAIVLNDMRQALRVWEMARKDGTENGFADLARKYSSEPGSRENGGEIPPICKNCGHPELETAAFALKEGELSGIIQEDNYCIILLCTGFTEPVDASFDEVKDLIRRDISIKKMQVAVSEEFAEIYDAASIENYLEGSVKSSKAADDANNPKTSLQEVTPESKK